MAGYRPRNRGNKTSFKPGPLVTRRLRAAGVNVSPAAARHIRDGVFVSAGLGNVVVHVNLGGYPDDEVRAEARNIAAIVTGWGLEPEVSEHRHEASGRLLVAVRFTYPEPEPAPEKVPTPPAEVDWVRLQRDAVHATLLSAGIGWSGEGVATTQESATSVTVSATGENVDELLARAEEALRPKRYVLERNGSTLVVRKAKRAKRRPTA